MTLVRSLALLFACSAPAWADDEMPTEVSFDRDWGASQAWKVLLRWDATVAPPEGDASNTGGVVRSAWTWAGDGENGTLTGSEGVASRITPRKDEVAQAISETAKADFEAQVMPKTEAPVEEAPEPVEEPEAPAEDAAPAEGEEAPAEGEAAPAEAGEGEAADDAAAEAPAEEAAPEEAPAEEAAADAADEAAEAAPAEEEAAGPPDLGEIVAGDVAGLFTNFFAALDGRTLETGRSIVEPGGATTWEVTGVGRCPDTGPGVTCATVVWTTLVGDAPLEGDALAAGQMRSVQTWFVEPSTLIPHEAVTETVVGFKADPESEATAVATVSRTWSFRAAAPPALREIEEE